MSFSATRILLSAKSASSKSWLARQSHDPYVKKRASNSLFNFRARSAFKLLELDEQWKFFKPDVRSVVDLGAAPGGWSQVAASKLGWMEDDMDEGSAGQEAPSHSGRGTIVAMDLLDMLPVPGVQTLKMDFLSPRADAAIHALLKDEQNPEGKADIILSDMAANMTGNKTADIESGLDIANAVITFARKHLRTVESVGRRKAGVLVIKYFQHPLTNSFRLEELKPYFTDIHNSKPKASRGNSSEGYWVCMGFKGDDARHRHNGYLGEKGG
ncbi:ribosomal RNA large subunit methyltransferase J [Fomitopsis serialis]|uniref:ribosomal RNA large subunit methyltransferase J n=1 Tax=Fomitopsis serialis TaxID=139415 RepID=UPI002008BD35|nr:ribosomal RNA large subunit methyltransferase J [Neoantrodia serialis]KAH9927595.1 ribosomal RNA large subunit methyltransferase J [Neoantrodia serialis]